MMKGWLYCCLLSLIREFNLSEGSVHRIQYRSISVERDARVIVECVKRVTSLLFEPSNRVVVIVSKEMLMNNSSLTNTILRSLSDDSNAVTVGSNFDFHQDSLSPRHYSTNRDSSYLIIDDSSKNLHKIFQSNDLPKWSEFLIITKINASTLTTFAGSLRQLGFLRFAFLQIEEKVSTLYDLEMKILTTFKDNNGGLEVVNFTDRIRAFSSFMCPTKGCSIMVGLIKNDMVGSTKVIESRRILDTGDHVVSFFVNNLIIQWKNHTLDNWTEALDAIVRDKVDVVYGTFIPRTEGLELLDVATWLNFEKVIFFDLIHIINWAPLTKIFSPLDPYVWFCLLICFILFWVFTVIVRKVHEKKMINEIIKIFNIWAILLGQGVRNPKNMGLRAVLSMWMITALLINAAYGSAFKSSLAAFVRLTPLDTFDDVNNSGRRIVGPIIARQLFQNSNDETDRLLDEKFRLVPPEKVFPVAIKDHDVGVDYDLNVKVHNIVERGFRTRLYTIKEPILVFPINFYMRKRHPYLKAFRHVVTRSRAGGLIQKWHVDDFESMEHRRLTMSIGRFKWKKTARLRQWSVSFKLWGTGNSIALIRFLYEIRKCRKERLKQLRKDNPVVDPIHDFKITKDFRTIWNAIEAVVSKVWQYSPSTNSNKPVKVYPSR